MPEDPNGASHGIGRSVVPRKHDRFDARDLVVSAGASTHDAGAVFQATVLADAPWIAGPALY